MLGTSLTDARERGHDGRQCRREHRGQRAGHLTIEGERAREECGNELDGQIAVCLAVCLGNVER
jgi:hypothetical protein